MGLDVDFSSISLELFLGENANPPSKNNEEGSFVILDPNFPIPASAQGKSDSFPRMEQSPKFISARWKGEIPRWDVLGGGRPNYQNEWGYLRKAWSLHRAGNVKLVSQKVKEASRRLYHNENLSGVQDWVWRFSQSISAPFYEDKIIPACNMLKDLLQNKSFTEFSAYYEQNSVERSAKYFRIYKEYFSLYSELSQVHFWVTSGLKIEPDHLVSSLNFESTKMLYGNAFEVLASLSDLPAFLNNLSAGRSFCRFEKLSFDDFAKLDKKSRLSTFAANAALSPLCEEVDNILRNASHHGGIEFNVNSQIVRYRTGKNGIGPEQQITYPEYLEKCVKIFLQIVMLLRLELLMCAGAKLKYPV